MEFLRGRNVSWPGLFKTQQQGPIEIKATAPTRGKVIDLALGAGSPAYKPVGSKATLLSAVVIHVTGTDSEFLAFNVDGHAYFFERIDKANASAFYPVDLRGSTVLFYPGDSLTSNGPIIYARIYEEPL